MSAPGAGTFRKLDEDAVRRLERHWEDGWNRQHLDTIMAPFAPDVVFSSPGIAMVTGDPSRTTIEGRDALRAYIKESFRLAAGIRYTLDATYVGTDSIVLVYRCGRGAGSEKVGSDVMRVGPDGHVVEWRCHY